MALFGVHALITLFVITWVPVYSPTISRTSFMAGLFIGGALPDMDMYATVILYLFDQRPSWEIHRSFLHSAIIMAVVCVLFWVLEVLLAISYKRSSFEYQIMQHNKDVHDVDLFGVRHTTREMNFKALAGGIYCAFILHIFTDILFVFSEVDILYPLSYLDISEPIIIWNYTPSDNVQLGLVLGELFSFALYLFALRYVVVSKLGRWKADDPAPQMRMYATDTDLEHHTMDYTAHSYKDSFCPYTLETLSKARKYLRIILILGVLQIVYFFVVLCVSFFVDYDFVFGLVYIEVMGVCVPSLYVFAWKFKDVLLVNL